MKIMTPTCVHFDFPNGWTLSVRTEHGTARVMAWPTDDPAAGGARFPFDGAMHGERECADDGEVLELMTLIATLSDTSAAVPGRGQIQ